MVGHTVYVLKKGEINLLIKHEIEPQLSITVLFFKLKMFREKSEKCHSAEIQVYF